MHTFEEIKPGARLRGLDPTGIAEVVSVSRFGNDALNLVFRVDGKVAEASRLEETSFEFVSIGRAYAFDADGGLLRLASEAVGNHFDLHTLAVVSGATPRVAAPDMPGRSAEGGISSAPR
jgi:hypothetical protein